MAKITEFFQADQDYDVGTIVVFGGNAEVTNSTSWEQSSVVGVVTGGKKAKTEVVLLGLADCQVVGNINPGDLLVTTNRPGVASAIKADPDDDGGAPSYSPGTVVGKASESYNSPDPGTIKVLVSLS